jgi:hypothetical protein
MRINPKDGKCRACGDVLEIIDADDATVTVQCLNCTEVYVVETDAFGDGAIFYYPHFVAERLARGAAMESTDDQAM